jgi:hypothetical protein
LLLGCPPWDIFHVAGLLDRVHELSKTSRRLGLRRFSESAAGEGEIDMRKATMVCAAALALAGLVWAASDPWKAKPYSQWDANEVRKVLNDSPWAKLVTVPASWRPDSGSDGSVGGLNPTGGPASSRGGGGRAGAAGGAAGGGGTDTGLPSAEFEVRWSSSRTIRAAALRSIALSSQSVDPDAEKQVAEPENYYEVAVVGRDMQPFIGASEDALKASTFLMLKKSKQKVSPESASITVGADGKTVQVVAFRFPKASPAGQPTVGADEKSIEFTTATGHVNIKVSFDVAKMEDATGRDL